MKIFSRKSNDQVNLKLTINELETQNIKINDQVDFSNALNFFSLTHSQLISFRAMLSIQEILNSVEDLTSSIEEIAASTQEVAASTEEITSATNGIKVMSANNLNEINETFILEEQAKKKLKVMINNINELNIKIRNIDDITKSISSVADQTNLLALNASIEAARAGVAGRGFNVVADEVRKLAYDTKEAVKKADVISSDMESVAKSTNNDIEAVIETFKQYSQGFSLVSESIKTNDNQIDETTKMIEAINASIQEQACITENIAKTSTEVQHNTKIIAELMENESKNLCNVVQSYIKVSGRDSIGSVLASRLIDHALFLQKVMNEAGTKIKVANHHECAFGKWYDSKKDDYSTIKEFKEIDEPHIRVHSTAQELCNNCSSHNAQEVIDSSLDLLKVFIKLYNAIA